MNRSSMFRITAKKVLSLLLILAMLPVLCACGDPNDQLQKAIEDNDYEKAANIFVKKLQGNTEKENAAYNTMRNKLEYAVTAYNSGKKSYDWSYNTISTVEHVGILPYDEIENAYRELDDLKSSKECFSDGEKYYDNGDYLDAYYAFCAVSHADSLHDQCEEKLSLCVSAIKNSLSEKTAAKIAEKDFLGALNDVDFYASALDYPNDLLQMEEEIYDAWYNSVKEVSQQLLDEGDYAAAVTAITAAIDTIGIENDAQTRLITLQEAAMDACLNDALAEAEKVFSTGKNYEGAIQVLQKAAVVLGDNDELWKKVEWYNTYAPVLLTSLEPTKTSKYITDSCYNDTDVNNTVYSEGGIIAPAGGMLASEVSDSEDDSYICYYLNSQYVDFRGILYRPYNTLTCKDTWSKPTVVKIFGDGVLLYEAPNFTQSTYDPVSFKVDVTGVRELKIVMMGVWTESASFGIYDRCPKVCAANLYIQK